MDVLLFLIPMALFLGGLGLMGFLWALRSGQFEDLDGAAQRILFDDLPPPGPVPSSGPAPGAGDAEGSCARSHPDPN
ncbi:cbb3-type cytochrome oxidase assembly protein CcoS [Pararhodospirillum oryzae]|uniref:Cytochrome oxidase maturation protein, cbb3-type n=1 Tax=Pararhodospirillum oryzae TaxID=478448 RepID=A0A512H6K1_9PROT|nr:cbb3-type cytochrome oxidase assembly protein CcoS [Pararhodospirillum oryzae]GEO81062.1 cytochrome oxidase maturation protein, cbb3-type [Pararhodospirillum oryzae]